MFREIRSISHHSFLFELIRLPSVHWAVGRTPGRTRGPYIPWNYRPIKHRRVCCALHL